MHRLLFLSIIVLYYSADIMLEFLCQLLESSNASNDVFQKDWILVFMETIIQRILKCCIDYGRF